MKSFPSTLLLKLAPVLLLGTLLLGTACSKSAPAEGSFANDLKSGPPAAVARTGIPDDSIKPTPIKPVARTGVPDDSVKPMPLKPILNGGVADDGVKPMPGRPVPPPPPR